MNALKFKDFISLTFTTVIDELVLAPEEEDGEQEQTDRNYWLNRGTKQTVEMADRMLEVISSFAPNQELKYNKYYIGLSSNGQTNNFVIFKPNIKKIWTFLISYRKSFFGSPKFSPKVS